MPPPSIPTLWPCLSSAAWTASECSEYCPEQTVPPNSGDSSQMTVHPCLWTVERGEPLGRSQRLFSSKVLLNAVGQFTLQSAKLAPCPPVVPRCLLTHILPNLNTNVFQWTFHLPLLLLPSWMDPWPYWSPLPPISEASPSPLRVLHLCFLCYFLLNILLLSPIIVRNLLDESDRNQIELAVSHKKEIYCCV